MLLSIITCCVNNRLITFMCVVVAFIVGATSMKQIPIDAIPDLSDTQVIIYSQWNASAETMEDQVTYPIVTGLLGLAKVKNVRALSAFGVSYVYVIFEDDTDIYWARNRVLEALSQVTVSLPQDVRTQLGPDATGVGWVYQYALQDTSGQHSVADLKSLQDWFLTYQLQMVPGVAQIASFGGFEKEYHVQIDPHLLRAYNISLTQITQAIAAGNNETGARVIEFSGTEYMVSAKGYIASRGDIEHIVVDVKKNGIPIYVKDIARVIQGPKMRRGVGDLNGLGDTVGGIVVMRFGENAHTVIRDIKKKIQELQLSLPAGVEIVETYNRNQLIQKSIATLSYELTVEMCVVALVIFLFLLHIPSTLVPVLTLGASVVISFALMKFMHVSVNIMSLGGIAIAVGAMVDAAIVAVENCHKKLEETQHSRSQSTREIVIAAMYEVVPASFYSLLVIAVSFLPIFALQAQEGRLFKPLAFTKTLVMLVAAVLSITLVPALLVTFIGMGKFERGPAKLRAWINVFWTPRTFSEKKHPISRLLFRLYGPCVDTVVRHRKKVVFLAFLGVAVTVPVYNKLGSEFMPPLVEGTILYMPTTMPGISITQAQALLQKQDTILKSFPEVLTVHGKAGRADTATDPAPLSMMETVVVLKDRRQWRKTKRWYSDLPSWMQWPFRRINPPYLSYPELIAQMDKKMQFPGLTNAWTMPIKGRIDMLSTGIRTPVGIKILGEDVQRIQQIGIQLEQVLAGVPGTRSVFAERIIGGSFLDVHFDRQALARHGISIRQAQQTFATAVGGKHVTTTIEGRQRYGVHVRYARAFRQNKEDIKNILLRSPKGYHLPLGDVASMKIRHGAGVIRNENGFLAGVVYVDLHVSDVGSYVKQAQEHVHNQLKLPTGYSLVWSGQYENMQRAQQRLAVTVPCVLLTILLLIYMNTRSLVKTGIVLLAIPFSAIGAVWLVALLGYNMSVAVWVGFIALLGVDAETGIYMLLYLDLAYEKRKKEGKMSSFSDLQQAIYAGAVQRIRPKMMTVLTTFLALLPILLANSADIGADVMKPMAAPMVGGILTSFVLELLVYPAVFALWKERDLPARQEH